MRILFLSLNTESDARDGITYTFIEKEMRALAEAGDTVYFIGQRLAADAEREGIHYLSRSRHLERSRWRRWWGHLRYLLLHFDFFGEFFWRGPVKTLALAAHERCIECVVRDYGIELLHTHFLFPSGESAVLSAEQSGVPVVATLRGAELYDAPEIEYGAMRSRFYRVVAERSVPRVDHLTAPNRFMVEEVIRRFDVPAERVEYLPNGVDVNVRPKAAASCPAGRLRLLAVGRLVPRKNHRPLVDAVIRAGPAVELKIVGDGPCAQELASLLDSNGANNVELVPEMSKDAVFELMRASDALINPSLVEGMPNVVLESLSLGVPCLVSDIAAHRDVVTEGVTGAFFDAREEEAMESVIRRFASDVERLHSMREACIARAREFSTDRKISRYREIYHSLCQTTTDLTHERTSA